MMKLRLIKVKKLAQPPTAGKQQGWDVNPGLAGTNGHAFSTARGCIHHLAKVGLNSGHALWPTAHRPVWRQDADCLELTSLGSSYCHALTCDNCQNYITSFFFFISWTCLPWHPLELKKTLPSSLSNLTRPWSSLKKNIPCYLRHCFNIHIYQLSICLNLYLEEQECSKT